VNTTISRRRILTAAVFAAIRATGLRAAQQPATHGQEHGPRFRAGVDAVRLSVTARDAAGKIVHNLRREEFAVVEGEVEQQIAHFGHHDSPISVVVLFDRSGSMFGDKLMHAKDAVVNFVGALQRQDEALVIAFSDDVDQLGRFGLDARTIARETNALRSDGGTRLYDAVAEGAKAITTPDRKEKRAILILTDGEDTSSRARIDDAVDAVRRSEVPVYAGPATTCRFPGHVVAMLGVLVILFSGVGGVAAAGASAGPSPTLPAEQR
jgi:Ca-activated chloride channel family protein